MKSMLPLHSLTCLLVAWCLFSTRSHLKTNTATKAYAFSTSNLSCSQSLSLYKRQNQHQRKLDLQTNSRLIPSYQFQKCKGSNLYSSLNDAFNEDEEQNQFLPPDSTNSNLDLGIIMPEEGLGSPCVIKVRKT